MHNALHIMSEQLAALTEQQQKQPPQHAAAHCGSVRPARSTADSAEERLWLGKEQQEQQQQQPQQQQKQPQEELIAKQNLDLAKQQQELALVSQRLQDVCALLAVKEDSLAHFTRHAMVLEQQVCFAAPFRIAITSSCRLP